MCPGVVPRALSVTSGREVMECGERLGEEGEVGSELCVWCYVYVFVRRGVVIGAR